MILPQLLLQFPVSLIILQILFTKVVVAMGDAPIAQRGCNESCGNVTIPCPFGMGPKHCYLDPWFQIECKPSPYSDGLFKPFLSKFNKYEVTEIHFNYLDHDPYSRIVTVLIPPLNSCTTVTQQLSSLDLRGSPYKFSEMYNVFVIEGCPGSAVVVNQSKTTMSGCVTICNSSKGAMATNDCDGVNCCQAPLHHDLQFYRIYFNNYYGNPYVSGGCQVPDECKGCHGQCYQNINATGYNMLNSYYCETKPSLSLASILGLCVGLGIVLSVISCYVLYRFIKRKREMKRRAKFFKRNGDMLLQQQFSSNEGVVERRKIFNTSELEKATDHFSENRVIRQGDQGTVYKGLLCDGRIVTIKNARLLVKVNYRWLFCLGYMIEM